LAAALGEWFDPGGLEFSYVFEHSGKGVDLETIHPIERGSGKPTLNKRGWPHPVNVQCETNIQRREFLLRPRLTLYLRSTDGELLTRLENGFRSPYFSFLIGRSQDLASCHVVEWVELPEGSDAFFSHTLVPFDWRPWVSPGATVLLPSAIDYERKRMAHQERYLQITKPLRVCGGADDVLDRGKLPERFAVDARDLREFDGISLARGLWFLPVRGPSEMA